MATGVPSTRRIKRLRYTLSYPGKLSRGEVLALPSSEPVEVETASSAGRLFRGDNLPALLWLRERSDVHNQVRSIYIDPPYATSMAFVDRDAKHAYDDHLDGAEYLESLRRRLIVLHDLLADNGSIFVHLDQNMIFETKVVMDEVFGRENFRNFITRKKCNTKNYTRNNFGNIADHILFYTKTDQNVWHRPYDAWTDLKVDEEYPCIDKKSGRRYKKVPVHAPGIRRGETGLPWRGKLPPTGKHWQYPPRKLDELDAAGEIYWSPNGNPRRKVFFDQSKGIPAQDIWMGFRDAHNQNVHITGYPTEKNFDLVCRLIAATTNPGDLVLDCYCGSGTTLEAAAQLERRFIGIDIAEAAISATVKRLRDGRSAMGDFVGVRGTKKSKPELPGLFAVNESNCESY
ncbi:MAG TPA: site-specific DNA-methyltransferase [Phycisphaerae bacterium]|nr:site-specific DNA-methyltransferase [Phycisphaerae bacterium]